MAASQHQGRLHGRTALITGSSSGLGRAIAFAYASEGANVCLVDRFYLPRNAINPKTGKADEVERRSASSPITLEALNAQYGTERVDEQAGPRFEFVEADMTVPASAENAVRKCVEVFGRLDIMVSNAGISVESTHERVLRCHETSEEDFDKTMAVNTKGVFLGSKYALKQMVDGQKPVDWDQKGDEKKDKWDRGWIINTASIQGLVGYLGTPSYCASKGAVIALTKQIAVDYAPNRIHCNALCPGFLMTAMTQNLQCVPEIVQAISAAHPFGGTGDVEDVARVAVFLASRDAAWVTGVPMVIDGGYTAQ